MHSSSLVEILPVQYSLYNSFLYSHWEKYRQITWLIHWKISNLYDIKIKYIKAQKRNTYFYLLYVSSVSEETVLENDITVQKAILTKERMKVQACLHFHKAVLGRMHCLFQLNFVVINRKLLEKLVLSARHHNIQKSGPLKVSLFWAYCMVHFLLFKILPDLIYKVQLQTYKSQDLLPWKTAFFSPSGVLYAHRKQL